MAKKPKKPKQPKASASLAVWQRWDQRMKAWKAKCKAIDDKPAKVAAIKRKYQ